MTSTNVRGTGCGREHGSSRASLRHWPALLLFAVLIGAGAAGAANLDRKIQFDIPPQTPLDRALIEWGRRSGMQVMMDARSVARKKALGVQGLFSARTALEALLKDTGLHYTIEGSTIAIGAGTSAPENEHSGSSVWSARDEKVLEEVVVTGSNLGAAVDPVSPVQAYTRAQIDQTGLGTVAAFIQSLPQNFGGGKSDATVGNLTGGVGVNASNGAAVNLRGVGSNASLVLINGRRLAAADLDGDFIDISMIPLAALDRVEVVTDGASAIYGSDAVGGVVNFVMRRDFEGAETRVRYGSVTDGSHHDIQAAQTFGHAWDGGSALLSYEFENSTPLNASDRRYTDVSRDQGPFTLLSEQNRQGVFVSAEQAIGIATLFVDALYGHRNTFSDFTADGLSQHSPAVTHGLSATIGLRGDILAGSTFELSSTYGGNATAARVVNLQLNDTPLSDLQTDSGIWSVDAKLNGELWKLPAGQMLYALGGQFRRESIRAQDRLNETRFERNRTISAVFLETRIPLLGPGSESANPRRLELSLAGRSERYSDFGTTSNPQVGLIWRPWNSAKLRGTFGTSFKAPVLSSLNPHLDGVVPLSEPDPLGAVTNVLVLFGGGNPHLQPEKARTWTAGLDWAPQELPGLRSSLTYYGIRYTNRIASASDSVGLFQLLQDASFLGTAVVQRDVPGAQIQALTQDPSFQNPFGIDTTAISTIANYTIPENLSVVTTSGIDMDIACSRSLGRAQMEFGVNATRIIRFRNQFTAAAPAVSVLNTVFNPVNLRARLRAVAQVGPFGTAAFLNYTNAYVDNRTGTPVPVSSWTTLDLTGSYAVRSSATALRGLVISLSAINVANRAPPHITGNADTPDIINYDGANANPLGRFISLQVTKQW